MAQSQRTRFSNADIDQLGDIEWSTPNFTSVRVQRLANGLIHVTTKDDNDQEKNHILTLQELNKLIGGSNQ